MHSLTVATTRQMIAAIEAGTLPWQRPRGRKWLSTFPLCQKVDGPFRALALSASGPKGAVNGWTAASEEKRMDFPMELSVL